MKHEPRCTGTRVCARCFHEKPALAFSADPNHSDGLASWCRDCTHFYNLRHNGELKTKAAMKNITFSSPGGMER